MRHSFLSVIVPARCLAALVPLALPLFLGLQARMVSADEDSAHLQARKKTAPYYQDAQICRSRSKADPLPDGADPAITIDASKYLACINQLGYHQEASTDPLLVGIQRCLSQKTKSATASGEISYRSPSQAQVRACLSARGFPSAGTPPNPNAPAAPHLNSGSTDLRSSKSNPTPEVSPSSARQPRAGIPEDSPIETVIIPPRNR